MMFLKKNKGKICIALLVFAALAAAYFLNGNNEKNTAEIPEIPEVATQQESEEKTEEILHESNVTAGENADKTEQKAEEEKQEIKNPVPEAEKTELYCTLSIRCDTILTDISRFNAEKLDILPKNGVIFAEKKVEFSEGESVFDLLLREMKNNKIHLEFVNTPVYDSVYIEGIGNIYEFDAGELSGWMYRVNGDFPNFGCSKYYLKQGDKVEFVYTCDLGKDVGGEYSGGQRNE